MSRKRVTTRPCSCADGRYALETGCRFTSRLSAVLCFFLFLSYAPALIAGVPEKGAILPVFQLPAPPEASDMSYLGVKGPTFEIKDLSYQVLLIEVIGVYCPRCYQQAPLFNTLFSKLNKKGMQEKVKMLAIAAGGSGNEVEHLRKSGSYEFPVVKDEAFVVHKLLGEPRTPFTILVDRNGKVLFAHLGIIEDIDSFYQQIQELLK